MLRVVTIAKFLALRGQKRRGDGGLLACFDVTRLPDFRIRFRAMALKALDQRLANNSSPQGSSSTNSSPQSTWLPPSQPATIARSDSLGASPPSTQNVRQNGGKSLSETDLTDSVKATSELR